MRMGVLRRGRVGRREGVVELVGRRGVGLLGTVIYDDAFLQNESHVIIYIRQNQHRGRRDAGKGSSSTSRIPIEGNEGAGIGNERFHSGASPGAQEAVAEPDSFAGH